MKNKKLFGIIVILFCILLVSQNYVQGFTLNTDTFRGASNSIGNWMKENVFFWYAVDTTGALKPEYSTQRKIVDFMLFFIMFFSLSLLGLKKTFKEGGNAVNALAFSIGFLLALSLVAFTPITLAIFFPFAKNIIFLVMLWIIFEILKKILGDKHKILLFILAAIIAWLAFNYAGPGLGVSNTSLPRQDFTTAIGDITSRIGALNSKGSLTPGEEKELANLNKQLAERYVSQGLTELEKRNYDAAEKNFREALLIDPTNTKAKYWLDEGLYNRMVKENVELLKVSRSVLESMNKEYKQTKDPNLCAKMVQMLTEISKTIKTLDEETAKRLVDVNREREALGVIECKRNSDCKDMKEGWVCSTENKCVMCTQDPRPDACGTGKECDTTTGKCKAVPTKSTSTSKTSSGQAPRKKFWGIF